MGVEILYGHRAVSHATRDCQGLGLRTWAHRRQRFVFSLRNCEVLYLTDYLLPVPISWEMNLWHWGVNTASGSLLTGCNLSTPPYYSII